MKGNEEELCSLAVNGTVLSGTGQVPHPTGFTLLNKERRNENESLMALKQTDKHSTCTMSLSIVERSNSQP